MHGSILDGELVLDALAEHRVTGVIHVAGFKYAGVSVTRPLHTYEQNVEGTRVLLGAMQERGVEKIVFSSSASVYGTPDVDLVTEDTPKRPESPYGQSKLIGEWLLADQAVAVGLRHTSLRYFNVVGSGEKSVFDVSPHNLFPLVFDALLSGRTPHINGDDYPTPDGTCVRDYIHVADLALAHVAAARRLDAGEADRAGVQPRQRRRGLRRADHGRGGRRHKQSVYPRSGATPAGRSGAHRRIRSPRRARSRLADAPHPARNGLQRVGGAATGRADFAPSRASQPSRLH